jgi:Fe-S cluster biogenesis protein NfuA
MDPGGRERRGGNDGSTGGATGEDAASIADRVEAFVARNFPQIAMHGGSAGVEAVDAETGEVWLSLGGACSGCGISPATVGALQARLPREVPEVTTVHADTGAGYAGERRGRDEGPDLTDVPF